ncbi:hypothetical protein RM780_10310 [Streptomyces sp. DSM 44917]|uniref:Integral membrane protein n=1 Tax=Streptomyces boetiae TaxID=3075541 RepID=A0ABU2L710_9ACTN|nr:hypothetical protein [Streptomyces sp. DSM 44917]
MILGAFEGAWGVSYLVEPPAAAGGTGVLADYGGVGAWAWLWVAGAVVACGAAFVRIGRDGAGFVAALVPPAVWSLVYAAAAVSGDHPRGGAAVVLYAAWSAIVMWAATVPEFSMPKGPKAPRGPRGPRGPAGPTGAGKGGRA